MLPVEIATPTGLHGLRPPMTDFIDPDPLFDSPHQLLSWARTILAEVPPSFLGAKELRARAAKAIGELRRTNPELFPPMSRRPGKRRPARHRPSR